MNETSVRRGDREVETESAGERERRDEQVRK